MKNFKRIKKTKSKLKEKLLAAICMINMFVMNTCINACANQTTTDQAANKLEGTKLYTGTKALLNDSCKALQGLDVGIVALVIVWNLFKAKTDVKEKQAGHIMTARNALIIGIVILVVVEVVNKVFSYYL